MKLSSANLEVVLQKNFLFQLTNYTYVQVLQKNVIILFLNKAVFIKKRTLLFQYFVLKIERLWNDHRGTSLIF